MVKTIVAIVGIGAVVAGSTYAYNAYRVSKNITITHQFRIFNFNAQGITLNGELFINNPVGSSIDLEYPQINLYLEGSESPIAINVSKNDFFYKIEPNGQTVVPDLNFTIPYIKLLRIASELAMNGKLKLRAKVHTAVRRGLLTFPVTMEKNIVIDLPTNLLQVISKL